MILLAVMAGSAGPALAWLPGGIERRDRVAQQLGFDKSRHGRTKQHKCSTDDG
jgi:hypothetical protein